VNKLAQYRYSASASSSLSFPHPPCSSEPEETPNLLFGEIDGFIPLLPVFTTGLIGLLFPPTGILCCSFPSVGHCISRKRTQDRFCFFPVSVDCPPVFFANSVVCGLMVMIYAEPGPEDLATLVPCFKIKGNGYRIATFTVPPIEAIYVTEVDGFDS